MEAIHTTTLCKEYGQKTAVDHLELSVTDKLQTTAQYYKPVTICEVCEKASGLVYTKLKKRGIPFPIIRKHTPFITAERKRPLSSGKAF